MNQRSLKLVLLPGLDGTGKLFAPLLALLPPSIDSIVLEYPNHKNLTIEELASFVEAHLPSGKFALLAESFSGLVTLQLLPRISSRLTSIIFVNTFAISPHPLKLRIFSYFPYLGLFSRFLPNWAIRAYCLGSQSSVTDCNWLRSILKQVPSKIISNRLNIIAKTKFTCHFD